MPKDQEMTAPETRALALFAGDRSAARRFWEFFTANIRNAHTRRAYFRAVERFAEWCLARGAELGKVEPAQVAAYIEQRGREVSKPSVKQELAAIRTLFDWLVVGQVMATNPALSVRGPRYVIRKGKTPVLSGTEIRSLLDSIEGDTVVGRRDRALIATMLYSFARVGAVVALRGVDYLPQGDRMWFRFQEKGGKVHEVPAHAAAAGYVDEWRRASGAGRDEAPLFRSIGKDGRLSWRPMQAGDVLRMIKRRAKAAGLPEAICCHTFRASGITAYLESGGSIEKAQAIAAHESPRTTKLYDRTADRILVEEVDRIQI